MAPFCFFTPVENDTGEYQSFHVEVKSSGKSQSRYKHLCMDSQKLPCFIASIIVIGKLISRSAELHQECFVLPERLYCISTF